MFTLKQCLCILETFESERAIAVSTTGTVVRIFTSSEGDGAFVVTRINKDRGDTFYHGLDDLSQINGHEICNWCVVAEASEGSPNVNGDGDWSGVANIGDFGLLFAEFTKRCENNNKDYVSFFEWMYKTVLEETTKDSVGTVEQRHLSEFAIPKNKKRQGRSR